MALGDEDAEVRTSAINGLWEHEDPALIHPLVHLLRTDQAVIVRATAATALGKFIKMRELEELDPYQVLLAEERFHGFPVRRIGFVQTDQDKRDSKHKKWPIPDK